MNENLNLVEILKDCKKGTKLYSTIYGDVELVEVRLNHKAYPIKIKFGEGSDMTGYCTNDGRLLVDFTGECTLFPSKEQRDWSKFKVKKPKFDPKTLQPFDKVLVQELGKWTIDFFAYFNPNSETPYYCIGHFADIILPYNDDTKHLVGTNIAAPEFYKY